MIFNTPQIAFTVGCAAPILAMFGWWALLHRARRQRAERGPIAERLLRPAGESLRKVIDELTEKLNEAIVLVVLWSFGMGFGMFHLTRAGWMAAIVGIVVVIVPNCFFVRRVVRLASERRNYVLGFHGERAVAEELNQLMLDGCRVFHDVPMEPYGNIDHVVVSPTGVYAVETKTRRKRKAPSGKRDHEVIFNGTTLEFPHFSDGHAVAQARQQAERLGTYLTKAVGEPVRAKGILTLPGWLVTSRVNSELKVLNPKQIRTVIAQGAPKLLSPQLIQRVAHQLDLKCRDVEL